MTGRFLLMLLAVMAAACSGSGVSDRAGSDRAMELNRRFARTVNLAGDLELERGATPLRARPDASDIADISERGFTAVRIPIDFASWAELNDPYRIDPAIFVEVDSIVAAAEANGLASIIDVHHYEAINMEPDLNAERLLALWRQIADRYRELPLDSVAFEVLNEPAETLTTERWNPILNDAVLAIREIDPNRTLIVGPGDYYDVDQLANFELPADDNLIATFHYYKPFPFTHQGADFSPGADAYLGLGFDPNGESADRIRSDFAAAAEWAASRNVPMLLGEFGAIRLAEQSDREAWTRTVREAAEAQGLSWAYWDWGAPNFGLHVGGVWDEAIMQALMPS